MMHHHNVALSEAPGPASQADRPDQLPIWSPCAPPAAAGAAGRDQQLGPRWGVPHPGARSLLAGQAGSHSRPATQQLHGIVLPGEQQGRLGTAGRATQLGQAAVLDAPQPGRLKTSAPFNAAAAPPPRCQHATAQQAAAAPPRGPPAPQLAPPAGLPTGSTSTQATGSGAITVLRGATPSPARRTPTSTAPGCLRQPQHVQPQPPQLQPWQQTAPGSAAAPSPADGPRQLEAADTQLLQDRQAVLDGLVLQLWEDELNFSFLQHSARRLKGLTWHQVDAATGQLQGQLPMQSVLRKWTQNVPPDPSVLVVCQDGQQRSRPMKLTAAAADCGHKLTQLDADLRQCRQAVRDQLEKLRMLAGEPLRLSRTLDGIAAWDSAATTPAAAAAAAGGGGHSSTSVRAQQMLAELWGRARQARQPCVLLRAPGADTTTAFSLAAVLQLQQQQTHLQALARDWPDSAPNLLQLPPFNDNTCCWLMHSSGSSGGSSSSSGGDGLGDASRPVSIAQLRQLLSTQQLPVVALVRHVADTQCKPVWAFDLAMLAVLNADYARRQAGGAGSGHQQQQQQAQPAPQPPEQREQEQEQRDTALSTGVQQAQGVAGPPTATLSGGGGRDSPGVGSAAHQQGLLVQVMPVQQQQQLDGQLDLLGQQQQPQQQQQQQLDTPLDVLAQRLLVAETPPSEPQLQQQQQQQQLQQQRDWQDLLQQAQTQWHGPVQQQQQQQCSVQSQSQGSHLPQTTRAASGSRSSPLLGQVVQGLLSSQHLQATSRVQQQQQGRQDPLSLQRVSALVHKRAQPQQQQYQQPSPLQQPPQQQYQQPSPLQQPPQQQEQQPPQQQQQQQQQHKGLRGRSLWEGVLLCPQQQQQPQQQTGHDLLPQQRQQAALCCPPTMQQEPQQQPQQQCSCSQQQVPLHNLQQQQQQQRCNQLKGQLLLQQLLLEHDLQLEAAVQSLPTPHQECQLKVVAQQPQNQHHPVQGVTSPAQEQQLQHVDQVLPSTEQQQQQHSHWHQDTAQQQPLPQQQQQHFAAAVRQDVFSAARQSLVQLQADLSQHEQQQPQQQHEQQSAAGGLHAFFRGWQQQLQQQACRRPAASLQERQHLQRQIDILRWLEQEQESQQQQQLLCVQAVQQLQQQQWQRLQELQQQQRQEAVGEQDHSSAAAWQSETEQCMLQHLLQQLQQGGEAAQQVLPPPPPLQQQHQQQATDSQLLHTVGAKEGDNSMEPAVAAATRQASTEGPLTPLPACVVQTGPGPLLSTAETPDTLAAEAAAAAAAATAAAARAVAEFAAAHAGTAAAAAAAAAERGVWQGSSLAPASQQQQQQQQPTLTAPLQAAGAPQAQVAPCPRHEQPPAAAPAAAAAEELDGNLPPQAKRRRTAATGKGLYGTAAAAAEAAPQSPAEGFGICQGLLPEAGPLSASSHGKQYNILTAEQQQPVRSSQLPGQQQQQQQQPLSSSASAEQSPVPPQVQEQVVRQSGQLAPAKGRTRQGLGGADKAPHRAPAATVAASAAAAAGGGDAAAASAATASLSSGSGRDVLSRSVVAPAGQQRQRRKASRGVGALTELEFCLYWGESDGCDSSDGCGGGSDSDAGADSEGGAGLATATACGEAGAASSAQNWLAEEPLPAAAQPEQQQQQQQRAAGSDPAAADGCQQQRQLAAAGVMQRRVPAPAVAAAGVQEQQHPYGRARRAAPQQLQPAAPAAHCVDAAVGSQHAGGALPHARGAEQRRRVTLRKRPAAAAQRDSAAAEHAADVAAAARQGLRLQPAAASTLLHAQPQLPVSPRVSDIQGQQLQLQQQQQALEQQDEQGLEVSADTVLPPAQQCMLQCRPAQSGAAAVAGPADALQAQEVVGSELPGSCMHDMQDATAAATAATAAEGSSRRGAKRHRETTVPRAVSPRPRSHADAAGFWGSGGSDSEDDEDAAGQPLLRFTARKRRTALVPHAPAAAAPQGLQTPSQGKKRAGKPRSRKAAALVAAAAGAGPSGADRAVAAALEGCSRATSASTVAELLQQRKQQQGYCSGLKRTLLLRERLAAPASAAAEVGVPYNRWGRYGVRHALPYSLLQPLRVSAAKSPASFKQQASAFAGLAVPGSARSGGGSGSRQQRAVQAAAEAQVVMPAAKRVVWQRSSIHGAGLFAAERIAAGDFVIEYKGLLIRPVLEDVLESRYEAQGQDSSYLFRIDKHRVADATVSGGLARFINHSCNPNCVCKAFYVNGVARMGIYAKRAIALGEELHYDYKFDFEEGDRRVPCRCGSANCRGFMN